MSHILWSSAVTQICRMVRTTTTTTRTETTTAIAAAATALVGFATWTMWKKNRSSSSSNGAEELPPFLSEEGVDGAPATVAARSSIQGKMDSISDEALIKLTRQLQFWIDEGLSESQLTKVTERLIEEATITATTTTTFQCPTVRFGMTELEMPIVTCGSMRFQYSWLPDSIPLISNNKSVVLGSASQSNLNDMVRLCFRHGLTHFETARMYGTSELQLVTVLKEMIDAGEIKRTDFIFQTKVPVYETQTEFIKAWNASWNICQALGYIDLFAFHCVSTPSSIDWLLAEGEETCYAYMLKMKQEGKVKHIGFSSHGFSAGIMKMIESKRFAYVNIHYHFFSSYHGSGTDDTRGGQGNLACLERAKELDMGVFIISPLDKGGKLYYPSATMARTIGPDLSPISFGCLHVWKTTGAHTGSIGFSRLADFDDALMAAQLYTKPESDTLLQDAEKRLRDRETEVLGAEWSKKGLLGLPDPYNPSTKLTGLGQMLSLHNLVAAFGMHSFAKDRYDNMLQVKWNAKKSFEANAKVMPGGNNGRYYDANIDLTEALSKHYSPELAKEKMEELHAWMTNEEEPKPEWKTAYDLQTWPEFANTSYILNHIPMLIWDSLTFGLIKSGGGPTKQVTTYAQSLRDALSK